MRDGRTSRMLWNSDELHDIFDGYEIEGMFKKKFMLIVIYLIVFS